MLSREKIQKVSMNGRMAYIVLCVEKYLITKYPEKDWSILSEKMWPVTSEAWDEWIESFIEIIPQYLFEFESYEDSDFEELTKEEYLSFVELYRGVSEGKYEDSSDKLGVLLSLLKDLEEVYCYTSIPGVGEESIDIVACACEMLESEGIGLPDIEKVDFSLFSEKNGWGNTFNGRKLSLIL